MKTANEAKIKELADLFKVALISGEASPLNSEYYSSSDRVICIISACGGSATPSQISKKLKVTSPRVTVVLNSMEKSGLISRALDKDDRRIIKVKLTAKGKKEYECMMQKIADYLKSFVEYAGTENEEQSISFFNDLFNFTVQKRGCRIKMRRLRFLCTEISGCRAGYF